VAVEARQSFAVAIRDVAAAAVLHTEAVVADRMPDLAAAGPGHSAPAAAATTRRARAAADPDPTRHDCRGSAGRC